MEVRTDEPDVRFAANASLTAGEHTVTVRSSRRHQGRLLVTFAEVADRGAAEALHGTELLARVDPDERPAETDEYYDRHLVGLTVRDAHGADRGTVVSVEHLPAQDVIVADIGGDAVRIPFVDALVPAVDVDGGWLSVADVPGLLDLSEADDAR